MDDYTKKNALIQLYESLKDSYNQDAERETWNTTLRVLGKQIVAPMLAIDTNEACRMWIYLLDRYYGKVRPVEFTALTDNIIEIAEVEELARAFKTDHKIMEYVYLKNPDDSPLREELLIREFVLNEYYSLAEECIKLYLQNDLDGKTQQRNLASVLDHIIDSSESRYQITSTGIDFIGKWLPLIKDPKTLAKLQAMFINLIDCVEGDAPKGAIPFSLLTRSGGMDMYLAEKRRVQQIEDAKTKKQTDKIQEDIQNRDRSQKATSSVSTQKSENKSTARSATSSQSDLNTALSELNALVGLHTVKAEVASLTNLMRLNQLRASKGLRIPEMSNHLVFAGNPGTGKTTVARIIGKIYHAIGLLSDGHLVEVDRSGLVAGYVGQTAIKTQEVIQSAIGGVLFIDEAYALTETDSGNDFGREAVDTLLKAMEDRRDDFVVIVAGYGDLMSRFVNSNPGLSSRFKRRIDFPDYTGEELQSIFMSMLFSHDYIIDPEAENALYSFFQNLYMTRGNNFGNGRTVRKIFEELITIQADRVTAMVSPTDDDISTISITDVKKVISGYHASL